MFLKLGPVEMTLLTAADAEFKLENITNLTFDGAKSIWVYTEEKKYHGHWTGSEVK